MGSMGDCTLSLLRVLALISDKSKFKSLMWYKLSTLEAFDKSLNLFDPQFSHL